MGEKTMANENANGETTCFELWEEDGFSREMRNLAMSLVMQVPAAPSPIHAASSDEGIVVGDTATVRLAERKDIAVICALRCAQSIEYWGLAQTDEAYRLFLAETESYVRRNLGNRVHFALVEVGGEVVSMSGLEVADRLPSVGTRGKAERNATVVSCYTLPQHRGKGYMRRILSIWSTIAPLIGVDTIYLESHNPSMQLLALDEGYDYVSEKYRLELVPGDGDAVRSAASQAAVLSPEQLPAG